MSEKTQLNNTSSGLGKYRQNIWQATHCSLNFFGLFTAFNAAQNVQSEALEEDGFAVGCIFSSSVLNKIGDIKCMALGSLINTPWIFAFALCGMKKENPEDQSFYYREDFITFLIILLSIINGFGQAVQWVGQGKYLSDCATEETKGFFFSYFWVFYMSSQIFGNLIAAYCLRTMSQANMFIILGLISFVSSISSLFLKKPNINHHQTRHIQDDIFRVNMGSGSIGDRQDLAILETRSNSSIQGGQGSQIDLPVKQTLREDIKSLAFMCMSKRMRRLIPQLFWTGISIAYYSSALTPMITDTMKGSDNKLEKSMIAMVTFGIGEVAGGIIIGQIIDRRGSKYVSIVNTAIVLIMTFVTLSFLGINQFNMLAFLMTFMWGIQDATVNTHCFEILGFEFDNNYEPFCIFNLAQALGVFFFQIIESSLDSRTKYMVYTTFIGVIGVYSCCLTYFFEFREINSQPEEIRQSYIQSQQNMSQRMHNNYMSNDIGGGAIDNYPNHKDNDIFQNNNVQQIKASVNYDEIENHQII
eukprot:403376713